MDNNLFGLESRVFLPGPDANCYFPADVTEKARASLSRMIQRGEGIGLLIGPTGTGKSLVCDLLAEEFEERFQVVKLACNRLCTRRALLQNLLFELELPFRALDEGELRLSLIDRLQPSPTCPNGMLLIVDEAHCLPLRLIDELRMITNLVRDGQSRVRLVLCGSARLEDRFNHPRLESLNQRIATRCYLQSFTREETFQYIQFQIEKAGGNATALFPEETLQTVFQATDGIPRLINQVCDQALLLTAQSQQPLVTPKQIEAAWIELQQIPAPWNIEEKSSSSPSEIEFGELGDFDNAQIPDIGPPPSNSIFGFASDIESGLVQRPSPTEVSPEHDALDLTSDAVEPETVAMEGDLPPSTSVNNPFEESFAEEVVILNQFTSIGQSSPTPIPLDTVTPLETVTCSQSLPISQALQHQQSNPTTTNESIEHSPAKPVPIDSSLESTEDEIPCTEQPASQTLDSSQLSIRQAVGTHSIGTSKKPYANTTSQQALDTTTPISDSPDRDGNSHSELIGIRENQIPISNSSSNSLSNVDRAATENILYIDQGDLHHLTRGPSHQQPNRVPSETTNQPASPSKSD